MSVSNPSYVSFTLGVGHSGPYPFSLDYDDPGEIKAVAYHSSTGVVELTVASVDDLNDTVTFTDVVASGSRLAIYRDTPATQLEEFRKSGDFRAERYEDAVDKLYHVLQGLQSQSSNSMKLHETQDGFDPVLPYDMTQFPKAAPRVKKSKNGLDVIAGIQLIADAADAAAEASVSADSAAQDALSAGIQVGLAESDAADVAAVSASVEAIAAPIDVTIIDLGTTGGNASIGNTYLVDTSEGDVPVSVINDVGSQGTLTIKNVSPDVNKVVISVPGNGADGHSTLTLVHPYQSITLTRSSDNWYISGEHNDVPHLSFPKLSYVDSSTVSIGSRPGCGDIIAVHMPDGRVWHHDGSLSVDLSISGAGGLDTGSVAAATFYYFYLVPSGSGWRDLAAIASATGPATGPSGYDQFTYVGSVLTAPAATDILKFVYSGARFYLYTPTDWPKMFQADSINGTEDQWLAIEPGLIASWSTQGSISTAIALADLMPVTYSRALINIEFRIFGTNNGQMRISPSDISNNNPSWGPSVGIFADGRVDSSCQNRSANVVFKWVDKGRTDHLWFAYNINGTNWTSVISHVQGWEDGWLTP